MTFREERIGGQRLILGDCLEVMPTLGRVDAVVTDPPYGIGFKYNRHDDDPNMWFSLMDAVIPSLREIAKFVVMPSCAIKRLPWWYQNHRPDWIIAWHKGSPGHASSIGFNDWEPHVVWGRPDRPMHDYFSTACGFDNNGHPCPKPEAYSRWLVDRAAPKGGTILDPFMGSGTTLVACQKLGRNGIGIEIDPEYFEIACKRVDEATRQPDLFIAPTPKAEQTTMFDGGAE